MSAPSSDARASTSSSGYQDGFGRRVLAFDRADGAVFERLYLRPEFSLYERTLREAFARAAATGDERIVAPRSIARDDVTGELVVVSPFVTGERLSDLLDAASEHARDEGAVPGIEVALGFLLDVLPALEALRASTGLPHGAVGPSRCVVTSAGRVLLTECGFAAVLQRLNLTRDRFWREFRIAMPPAAGSVRFDATADISQSALSAVMLVLGRPMTDDDAADVLPELMAEVIEIAQIRCNVTFAINLQRFLQRALPLPGRRPYQTIDAALHDVVQLASSIGVDLCQSALADFVRHTSPISAAHDRRAPAPRETSDRVTQIDVETQPRAPEVFVSIESVPDLPAPALVDWPEPIGAPAEVPVAAVDEKHETLVTEAPAASFEWPIAEPVAVDAATPAEYEEIRRELDAALEPPEEFQPEIDATPEPTVVEAPQPVVIPQSRAARRRSRANRKSGDTLRSVVAPVPAPEPPQPAAPTPLVENVAAPVTRPPTPLPPPVVVESIPIVPQPVLPQPVFVPLSIPPTDRIWEAARAAVPPPALAPAPPALIAAPTPVRLKTEPPASLAARERKYEPRMFSGSYPDPRPRDRSEPRTIPWKYVAAAAVAMIVMAAARAYLPDTDSVKAEANGASAPVTVAAPPPVTTGTIVVQTQPAGARVLLDGSPAGETPLRIVDVAPGRHVLTFITHSSTVKRTVKVEADKTLTLDVPVFSGWVAIFAPILLEVSEEGRAVGTTADERLMLSPGRHTLTLTNREFGYSASHAVDVEAGEVRTLNVQPTGAVNLNAVPWAEVWIDGKKAGETPLANLTLPLGNREIIFRHPELGERRTMTRVAAGAPTAVTVDFTR